MTHDISTLSTTDQTTGPAIKPVWIAIPLVLALLVGGTLGWFFTRPDFPGDDSSDAGFARDMSTHHAQAVRMAGIVYRRTDDEQIRWLAYDILTTQQAQIGVMGAWLDEWGLSPTGLDKPMTWMGHPVDGLMPGMATEEEIQSLETLPVDQMNQEFLRLMIVHHQSGVEMAQACMDMCKDQDVLDLTSAIVPGQAGEIVLMNDILARLGATPVDTETGSDGHDMSDMDMSATPTP